MSLSEGVDKVEKSRSKDCEQVMTMIVRVVGRGMWAAEDLSGTKFDSTKDRSDLRFGSHLSLSVPFQSSLGLSRQKAPTDLRCDTQRSQKRFHWHSQFFP